MNLYWKLKRSIQESKKAKHTRICYLWKNKIGYIHMRTYPCNRWGYGYWRRRSRGEL